MTITIEAGPEEIAALVVGLQERRGAFHPEDADGASQAGPSQRCCC